MATSAGDCDGDGVTNAAEINGPDGVIGGGDGTNPTNPCSLNVSQVTITATSTGDCDGDGVTNANEINGTDGNPLTTTDNTNPTDPCSFNASQITLTVTSTTSCDSDGDGNPDSTDPAPNDPCTGYVVGSEVGTGSSWASTDCDGDGVTNGAEKSTAVGPATDPYNPSGQFVG